MPDEIKAQARNAENALQRPKTCYWVGGALGLYLAAAVAVIFLVHLNVLESITKSPLLRAHVLCGAFGMLGSSMAAIRKYYRSLITESTSAASGATATPLLWDFGWVFYYLTRPILGGILGALSFTLSFVGFHILAQPAQIELSNEGRYLLFALAFISGFAVSQALDRLNSVAKELLQTDASKPRN
jgi:hypothetical protein